MSLSASVVRSQVEAVLDRANLHAAFGRVAENRGCRGADGVTIGQFRERLAEELDFLEASVRRRVYVPYPLLRIEVPKRSGGVRALAIPSVRDRVLQTAVDRVVRPIFEAEFEASSFAFREGRSVGDAIRRVAELRDLGFRFVVDADVDACFDSISHDLLLARLARLGLAPPLFRFFERWVRAEIWDGSRLYDLEVGIPQGSTVSPLLANLFLDTLDERLAAAGQQVVRYADDLVVLCREPAAAESALELTEQILADLALVLNAEKTRVTSFEAGFRFLGATFLRDGIYRPWETAHREPSNVILPPMLDLSTYLALRAEGTGWRFST